MDSRYRVTDLPLDAPDDDPRWQQFVDAQRLGFVEGRSTPGIVETVRRHYRLGGNRLRGAELVEVPAGLEGLALTGPVATFSSWDGRIDVGGAMVPCNLISDVTVRSTHRRRGLLRELMTLDLR